MPACRLNRHSLLHPAECTSWQILWATQRFYLPTSDVTISCTVIQVKHPCRCLIQNWRGSDCTCSTMRQARPIQSNPKMGTLAPSEVFVLCRDVTFPGGWAAGVHTISRKEQLHVTTAGSSFSILNAESYKILIMSGKSWGCCVVTHLNRHNRGRLKVTLRALTYCMREQNRKITRHTYSYMILDCCTQYGSIISSSHKNSLEHQKPSQKLKSQMEERERGSI